MKFSDFEAREFSEWLPEALFLEDLEGKILDVNDHTCELLGYDREELVGEDVDKIVPEGVEVYMHERIQKATRAGEPIETVNLHKDGSQVPVELRGEIVEIDGNKRLLLSMREISERKQAEEALNEERDKLKRLHQAVEKLQQETSERDLAQKGVEVAESMLDFELCAVAFLEGDYLVPRAVSSKLDHDETKRFKLGEGIAGKAVEEGKTFWDDDVRDYPEAKPTREDFRSFISVPIGELGVLQVISREVGKFDEGDVELSEILAGHLKENLRRI